MNPMKIGNYIAKKRKERNITQASLADRLGISNKTISKWETGTCMPDYSIMKQLCKELGVTISELLDGEDKSTGMDNDSQIIPLMKRVQVLENQKHLFMDLY